MLANTLKRLATAVGRADERILDHTEHARHPSLDTAVTVLTRAGDHGLIWPPLGIAVHQGRRTAAAVATTLAACKLLEQATPRSRPNHRRKLASHGDSSSFPSSHAATAAAAFWVLQNAAPRGRPAWLALAAAIAASRVYTAVHYTTDVLAGAAIGSAVGIAFTQRGIF